VENTGKRIANISIVVKDRDEAAKVNEILGKHGDIIRGRLGIPCPDRSVSVIIILVEADNSKISAISGAVGNIPGVSLRSTILL